MAKSRKSNVMKTIKRTLPVVNNGLTKVGTAAKDVAEASIPIVEKVFLLFMVQWRLD